MQAVSSAARMIALVMTWLAVGLTVMAAVTVIAARRRKGAWSWTGVGCIGILLITLLIVAMHGTARLDAITAKATEAVGNNSAIAPPPPTPTPAPPFTVEHARSGIRDMVNVSLDAAVKPLADATGLPIDVEALTPTATSCTETGAQLTLVVDFRTSDNERSLQRILATWDDAGYAPDRAIQVDIRFSDTLPVARMDIRDTATIDGMMHMNIVSRCATVE